MSVDRQRWRWSIASALALMAVFLLLALNESWWQRIGVFHMRPYFADTVAILAAGEARRAGLDVYQAPNPFDPLGRPHVYGPAWLALARLDLTTGDAWWIGTLFALLTVGVALWLLAPRRFADALGVCLLILSPPVLLGLERGNNDLVVFLMLALAAVCFAARSAGGGAVGAGVIVFAAVLKFYPLVALAAVLTRRERVARFAWIVLGALALFGALWWAQRVEFFRVLAIAPRPETIYAYGIRVLPLAWAHADARPWLSAGLMLGGLFAALALWRGRAAIDHIIPDEGLRAAAAVGGGTSWLFCFLANNNYSYRAILWLLVVPAWFELTRSAEAASRALGRGLCLLLLVALWTFMPKFFAIELLRAEGGASATLWHWVLFVSGVEQALILALSTVVLVALVAWAWRRGRILISLG